MVSHLHKAVVNLPCCSLSDTTREKRRQEKEGVDYHFVSILMFEEAILNHRYKCKWSLWGFFCNSPTCVLFIYLLFNEWYPTFLPFYSVCRAFLSLSVMFISVSRLTEYGIFRGHYYGTSLDSIHKVMAEGKVCLLDVHPSVSNMLLGKYWINESQTMLNGFWSKTNSDNKKNHNQTPKSPICQVKFYAGFRINYVYC